ncbi:hypothetical protein C8P63_108118 [Melghirimyces profundicolus]|uniref:Short-subunit dehydrogenase n=1 Tax=Melghirimyces profundicolus TaxID=1242148 RepID=A0A2T6BXK8_9BACL|nr:SDR family oxidoreductase [Melghirimyces profundicolus]PTX60808.1 hypothetical protein C8P63_108118 [Melghirimyces profundicolus]
MSVALITGASSGIGEAFARLLSGKGYHVVLVARRKDRLSQLADELDGKGGTAEVLPADLVEEEGVEEIRKHIRNHRVDLLVNNAGFGLYGPVTETLDTREQEMIRLNVSALVSLTRAVLPQMVKRNSGGIIQVASTASFLPTPYMAGYGATKAFVLHYSEALTAELKGTGVKVTAVCPGSTVSEFAERTGIRQKFPMSAEKVAELGLKAWEKGQPVVVTGSGNKAAASLPRFLPRSWMARLVARAFRDRT